MIFLAVIKREQYFHTSVQFISTDLLIRIVTGDTVPYFFIFTFLENPFGNSQIDLCSEPKFRVNMPVTMIHN